MLEQRRQNCLLTVGDLLKKKKKNQISKNFDGQDQNRLPKLSTEKSSHLAKLGVYKKFRKITRRSKIPILSSSWLPWIVLISRWTPQENKLSSSSMQVHPMKNLAKPDLPLFKQGGNQLFESLKRRKAAF